MLMWWLLLLLLLCTAVVANKGSTTFVQRDNSWKPTTCKLILMLLLLLLQWQRRVRPPLYRQTAVAPTRKRPHDADAVLYSSTERSTSTSSTEPQQRRVLLVQYKETPVASIICCFRATDSLHPSYVLLLLSTAECVSRRYSQVLM